MEQIIQIQWTCGNLEEARRIAKELIEKRLVACANLIPRVESHYVWEGKAVQDEEVKVLLKSTEDHFDEVSAFIRREASYALPEVTFIRLDGGRGRYLGWG